MVVAVDGGMSVGYLLMMLLAAYFLTGLTLFGYQQIAMLELPFGTQLKNAALLIFAGKLRAFFAIVVWVGMLLVPVIYYGLAAYILLAGWVAIMKFSVPVTVTMSVVMWAPLRRVQPCGSLAIM